MELSPIAGRRGVSRRGITFKCVFLLEKADLANIGATIGATACCLTTGAANRAEKTPPDRPDQV